MKYIAVSVIYEVVLTSTFTIRIGEQNIKVKLTKQKVGGKVKDRVLIWSSMVIVIAFVQMKLLKGFQ